MKYLYILLAFAGLSACQSNSKSSTAGLKATYDLALKAQDRETVISTLTQWVAQDSSVDAWVLDTLAYYHYFYKVIPGMVRSSKTPMFYTEMGLKKNPNSLFLRDIKAKLLLEEGKDTIAFEMFSQMWKETQDPTYFWDLTWIEIARGRMAVADSMITVALTDATLKPKKVAMEHIQAQITERVATEAAFLFLKYQLSVANRNIMQGADYLQKALEIEPNFYAARRSIVDLQRMSAANR
jgi:hypothetical protein